MSKREGESAHGGEDAKKQRMEDDEQTVVSAGPYEKATKYRTFKLVVEGKTLFVNPHFLGEMSPFFDTLFLGNFKEGKEGEAELKEVTYGDVVEMLHVMGADYSKIRHEIRDSNCISMMRLAHRWAIDILMMRCTNFIEKQFNMSTITFTTELFMVCEELQITGKPLQKVASRLASFEPDVLLKEEIHRKIKNTSLCTAIFVASNRPFDIASANSHVFLHRDTFSTKPRESTGSACSIDGCRLKETNNCHFCKKELCRTHALQHCFARSEVDKDVVEHNRRRFSYRLSPLNERFFSSEKSN